MATSEPPDEQPTEDDTTLLIAALNHAWAFYDAEINRGLQVLNYFLVATAVLAAAYVSAINGRLYLVAAVLALAGMANTTVTLLIGMRQRAAAHPAALEVRELYGRMTRRLKLELAPMTRSERGGRLARQAVPIAFALKFTLDTGALLYAVAH